MNGTCDVRQRATSIERCLGTLIIEEESAYVSLVKHQKERNYFRVIPTALFLFPEIRNSKCLNVT